MWGTKLYLVVYLVVSIRLKSVIAHPYPVPTPHVYDVMEFNVMPRRDMNENKTASGTKSDKITEKRNTDAYEGFKTVQPVS